jgi:hypothetical protein
MRGVRQQQQRQRDWVSDHLPLTVSQVLTQTRPWAQELEAERPRLYTPVTVEEELALPPLAPLTPRSRSMVDLGKKIRDDARSLMRVVGPPSTEDLFNSEEEKEEITSEYVDEDYPFSAVFPSDDDRAKAEAKAKAKPKPRLPSDVKSEWERIRKRIIHSSRHHEYQRALSLDLLSNTLVATMPVLQTYGTRFGESRGIVENLFIDWIMCVIETCSSNQVEIGNVEFPRDTKEWKHLDDADMGSRESFFQSYAEYTKDLRFLTEAIRMAQVTMMHNYQDIFAGLGLADFIIGRRGYDFRVGPHASYVQCVVFTESKMRVFFFRLVVAIILNHWDGSAREEQNQLIEVIINSHADEVNMW